MIDQIFKERLPLGELAPPREWRGGLYTTFLKNRTLCEQMIQFRATQAIAGLGLATISEKIALFTALSRRGLAFLTTGRRAACYQPARLHSGRCYDQVLF
jgi:hypothetical protein